MFVGEYNYSLDEKKRLAIPVKFRKDFKAGIVVTRGVDSCLFIYTLQEWQKLADKISKLPINQANTRAFTRLMLAGAMDTKLDSAGRMILPDYLCQYAKIQRKVVITGLYNRLEIWDETQWANYQKRSEEESQTIAENLGELGI
jgi:MraZ protein